MTRPAVLDMDLVVVPREATGVMVMSGEDGFESQLDKRLGAARRAPWPSEEFEELAARTAYRAMLSASPYPTAWDDVRKYVEGLERERDDMSVASERYADWARKALADKTVSEDRIAELEKEKHAALTMIAMLEKRLADAERVIEPFSLIVTEGIAKRNDAYTSITTCTDYFRAARAYMEGK